MHDADEKLFDVKVNVNVPRDLKIKNCSLGNILEKLIKSDLEEAIKFKEKCKKSC